MLTLKECRKLIDPKNEKYSDEQLQMKLDFLTQLASIIMNDLKREDNEKESGTDGSGIE